MLLNPATCSLWHGALATWQRSSGGTLACTPPSFSADARTRLWSCQDTTSRQQCRHAESSYHAWGHMPRTSPKAAAAATQLLYPTLLKKDQPSTCPTQIVALHTAGCPPMSTNDLHAPCMPCIVLLSNHEGCFMWPRGRHAWPPVDHTRLPKTL